MACQSISSFYIRLLLWSSKYLFIYRLYKRNDERKKNNNLFFYYHISPVLSFVIDREKKTKILLLMVDIQRHTSIVLFLGEVVLSSLSIFIMPDHAKRKTNK